MSRRFAAGRSSILVIGVALALPPVLRAQSYTDQMQGYMARYAQDFAYSQGYQSTGNMQTGSTNQGTNTSHYVQLSGGMSYVIIGVCDRDCTDVDLRLFDPSGNNIATDVATDDHPTLRFQASMNGNYRLQVEMPNCSHNPCFYGFQVFMRGGGGVAMNQPQPMPMSPQPQPMNMSGPTAMGQIAVNQQVTGNLTPNDGRLDNKPAQAWAFACQAGQSIQMDILSTWDNYAVILDPVNNRAAQDDDSGEGLNARISYTCGMTGVYRLVVTTYTASTSTGTYTLQVQGTGQTTLNQPQAMNNPQPMAAPQPMSAPTTTSNIPMPTQRTQTQSASGATMPTPSPMTNLPITGSILAPGTEGTIQAGQNVQGRLESGDQRMNNGTYADVWNFQGTAGQHIVIELRSTEFDSYLQLLDASGTRLAEDDDGLGDQNSRIEVTLPSNGIYKIVVNNFDESRPTGLYILSLR